MGDVAPTSGNNTGSRLALPPRSFGPDAEPELPTGPRLGAADRPETRSCRPARDLELPTGPRLCLKAPWTERTEFPTKEWPLADGERQR